MAVTKRQRETNHLIFGKRRGDESQRFGWRYDTFKLIDGEWERMGHFQSVEEMPAIERHAAAIGGLVKLIRKRGGIELARWLDGVRVEEGKAAE